jgi:hypothetical protein
MKKCIESADQVMSLLFGNNAKKTRERLKNSMINGAGVILTMFTDRASYEYEKYNYL